MSKKKRNSGFQTSKKNIWIKKIIEIIFKIFLWLFGAGLIWGAFYNRPNLKIEAVESEKGPFYQEFLLENVGNREAIVQRIYINGMKLDGDFDWNQSNTEMGPLLNAVELTLSQHQEFKFSLNLFRPNIPNLLLHSQYKEAAFSLKIYYYDTFKIFEFSKIFSFQLINNHWQLMGNFSKNNLGI